MPSRAALIKERLEQLGAISEISTELYRPYGSSAMRRANELVAEWMREARLNPQIDAIGNLRGSRPAETAQPGKRLFMLGSHLDTVRNAGKYDGALGVVLAIEAVRELTLPFDIEVIGFCDEEGDRFHSAYLGSGAMAGQPVNLNLRDSAGISLREAILQFGGDPENLNSVRPKTPELLGYLEAHIEQGPVLQHEGCALGVVTAISAQIRVALSLQGAAGHAGTVPMGLRRDALCAAAELILEVESLGLSIPGLVATVGKIDARPGASNVIPGTVFLTLDLRHANESILQKAQETIHEKFHEIALRRSMFPRWELVLGAPAVHCSEVLISRLSDAARMVQKSVPLLASGAGHDAVAMAALCPVAMLFVRCLDGVSHHPDEFVTTDDLEEALVAMENFLVRTAALEGAGGGISELPRSPES